MLSKAVTSAVSAATLNPQTSKLFGFIRVSYVSSDSLVFRWKSSFNADSLKSRRRCLRMESSMTRASAQPFKNADERINSVETFIFDCDEIKSLNSVLAPVDVGAVVVGFDRYFNSYKVQYGTPCIRENPACLFIATNRDAVTHLTDAQQWAGDGSMVGAICGSTQREPLVVGKPWTFMMDYLANKFGILKSQICMVRDRLDTDILFGENGGCKTLLGLSAN